MAPGGSELVLPTPRERGVPSVGLARAFGTPRRLGNLPAGPPRPLEPERDEERPGDHQPGAGEHLRTRLLAQDDDAE